MIGREALTTYLAGVFRRPVDVLALRPLTKMEEGAPAEPVVT